MPHSDHPEYNDGPIESVRNDPPQFNSANCPCRCGCMCDASSDGEDDDHAGSAMSASHPSVSETNRDTSTESSCACSSVPLPVSFPTQPRFSVHGGETKWIPTRWSYFMMNEDGFTIVERPPRPSMDLMSNRSSTPPSTRAEPRTAGYPSATESSKEPLPGYFSRPPLRLTADAPSKLIRIPVQALWWDSYEPSAMAAYSRFIDDEDLRASECS